MSVSDNELAALVIATKDHAAFSELVRRHQTVVRGMLSRMTNNRALAEDLSQDAFIRAFEKIGSFKGEGSFRGWLCRIAYTEFLQARRKRKSVERTMERFKVETETEPAGSVDWDRGDAMDLDRALKVLSEPERACIVLCYACGMSHSEASEATGMPLGTVKSHVNRGREKMKALLVSEEAG